MNQTTSDQPTTLLAYPMQLLGKPNSWSCIATSFAMVLGISVDEFFATLGHDGSEIVNQSLPHDPMRRRGVHIQECILVAMQHGKSVTPVELVPQVSTPVSSGPGSIVTQVKYHGSVSNNWERFARLLLTTRGVVTGRSRICDHAAAYSHGVIYDPDTPEQYPYSRNNCEMRGFYTQCLWIVT